MPGIRVLYNTVLYILHIYCMLYCTMYNSNVFNHFSNYVALLQKKWKQISINTGNCVEKKYFIKNKKSSFQKIPVKS